MEICLSVKNVTVGASKRGWKQSNSECEPYCKITMSHTQRFSFARFHCRVEPIRIETGRNERLPLTDRVCPFCETYVEDELHVITQCAVYDNITEDLYSFAYRRNFDFFILSPLVKFVYVINDKNVVLCMARTCFKYFLEKVILLKTRYNFYLSCFIKLFYSF